jgi:hypothetical protein
MGMFERGIIKLASRRIDNDHKTDGHSPENIQSKKSLFGSSHFRDLGSDVRRRDPSSETSGIFQSPGAHLKKNSFRLCVGVYKELV